MLAYARTDFEINNKGEDINIQSQKTMLVLCSNNYQSRDTCFISTKFQQEWLSDKYKTTLPSTNLCPLLKYNSFNSHADTHNFQCSFPKISLDGQSNIKYKPSTLKNANFPPNIPPHVPTKIRSKKKGPKTHTK